MRGAVTLISSTVAGSALGVVFWLVGARLYSPEQLGRAAAGVSAVTLLAGIAQLSLSTVLVRYLPTAGAAAGRMLGYSQAAVTSLAVIFAAGFWFLGFTDDFLPAGSLPFLLFCATVAAATVTALHDGAFTGLGRPSWVPVRTAGAAVLRLVLLAALAGGALAAPVFLGWSLPTIAVAVLTCSALLVPRVRTAVTPGREALPSRRELTHFVSSQYLSGAVSTISSYAPPLIVTAVLGPAVNGTAFYLPWLVATVGGAMSWNVVVAFIVTVAADPARTRQHLRHAIRLLAIISLGGGGLLALGAPLAPLVLGSQYADSVTPLRIIAAAMPLSVLAFLYGAAVIIRQRPWRTLWLNLASTTLFLGGAWWAIGRYGVVGVLGAMLVADVIITAALLGPTVRELRQLLADGDRAAAEESAPAPARGVARVPRVGPGSDTGSLTVVFFPTEIGDWLAKAETARFERIRRDDAAGNPRGVPSSTTFADTTARLPRMSDRGSVSDDDTARLHRVPEQVDPTSGRDR